MKTLLSLLALLFALPTWAGSPAVFEARLPGPLDTHYDAVSRALDAGGFFVIFEPDLGRNLAGMQKRLGEDYNRNKLSGIRSLVFCSGWYANQMGNQDPAMLTLCPLHLTLVEKDGQTTLSFIKPSAVAAGSPAEALARELEADLLKALSPVLKPAP